MTDWYMSMFGRPAPGRAAREPQGRYTAPSPPPPPPPAQSFPFPMGTDQSQPSRLMDDAFYMRQRETYSEFGRQAGALARRSARRPQLPAMPEDEQVSRFPFPMGTGGPDYTETRRAAAAVGVPRRYLDTLIVQESGGNPEARAPTSSATGHAQFIDSTWLRMMNDYGPRYGYGQGNLANLSNEDVLALRTDPAWAAVMAAEYARENATALKGAIGREPTDGEVYMAHFLGPGEAAELINAAAQDSRRGGRGRRATDFVAREVAEANRAIFFDERGHARSVGQVVAMQSRKFSRDAFRLNSRLGD